MQNATCTFLWLLSKSVTIPIVPLHIPCSIRELFRNMTRAPCCNLTVVGKFVFDLNSLWENCVSMRVPSKKNFHIFTLLQVYCAFSWQECGGFFLPGNLCPCGGGCH